MDRDGNSKHNNRRRYDNNYRETNSTPHGGQLSSLVGEPALRLHNFRISFRIEQAKRRCSGWNQKQMGPDKERAKVRDKPWPPANREGKRHHAVGHRRSCYEPRQPSAFKKDKVRRQFLSFNLG